ncbi:NACHT domain-containing protein [Crepidotus variabilis]|uniref:NACHT domain-containing protein n=1 Tax=Crepidotus variabilis TaxID=179855 RepID=A0A9P6E9R6_9AGAR|nr:NACHT domain-containing protein [Crepidotus variabilis]
MANDGVHFFKDARNVHIEGSIFNISSNAGAGADFLTILYQVITQDALHNASRKESVVRCLPGTRTRIIEKVEQSLNELEGPQFLWLRGPAGFGKTAIAQSICEQLLKDGRLGGDFFFSLVGGRTDHRHLFLTIAYRLAKSNPTLKAAIESVARRDPEIVNASLEDQFRRLIVDPLNSLGVNDGILPLVIVIDGLDECDGESNQTKILHLISSTLKSETLPIRFLIVSRPEPWIAHVFESTDSLTIIPLEEDDAADEGIRLFYNTEFAKLRTGPKYRHLFSGMREQWPSEAELDELVKLAAGQFIFATTVIRCATESGLGSSPMERLTELLTTHSTSESTHFDLLDSLYKLILSKSDDWKSTVEILGAMEGLVDRRVSHVDSIFTPEYLDILEVLLGLAEGSIYTNLYNVHSVAFVPESLATARMGLDTDGYKALLDQNQHKAFKFHHKSFIDFLRAKNRSGIYFVDEPISNQLLVRLFFTFTQKQPLDTWIHSVTWIVSQHLFWRLLYRTGQMGNRELVKMCFSRLRIVIFIKEGVGWCSTTLPALASKWTFQPKYEEVSYPH